MFVYVAAWLGLLTVASADIQVYPLEVPHTITEEFRDLPASFGADLPSAGLRALLTVGEPEDGCSPLPKPPTVDNFTGKWAVLLARYNCSFEVKVRNAQTAGYDLAVVHNVNSSDLETMSAKDPKGIIIPSVFVSDNAGFALSEEYLYTNNFYIMVDGDLPFDINTHLLLPFAIVVALCLLVMLIFMIVKCIKDRRRARRHRLPNRSLKKIPTCKFSKGDPYETCAICLDDYQEGDRLRVLPCAHAYHTNCIDPWLTQNKRVCPVCKRRVLTVGERRRRHSSDSDSDDSSAPLVSTVPSTQGGTFQEQRENPFQRAARFLRRGAREQTVEVASPEAEEADSQNEAVQDTGADTDTSPLIRPSVRSVSERRGRRGARRTRSAGAPNPAPPPLSINNNEGGEIGVVAIPAPHVDL